MTDVEMFARVLFPDGVPPGGSPPTVTFALDGDTWLAARLLRIVRAIETILGLTREGAILRAHIMLDQIEGHLHTDVEDGLIRHRPTGFAPVPGYYYTEIYQDLVGEAVAELVDTSGTESRLSRIEAITMILSALVSRAGHSALDSRDRDDDDA